MNKDKVGEPFRYPDIFLLLLGYAKVYFHLPFRQTEGIAQGHAYGKVPSIPDYTTISRRINRLDIKVDDDKSKDFEDEYIVIAIDSTGIKVTNRGQWMQDKWHVKKKGYLKIHIAVNIKTKEILALEATDEKVHDSKMLKKLVNQVLKIKPHRIRIRSVLADGAHDTNKNFQYLEDKIITPGIKVRKNSIVSSRNNKLRNKEGRLQTKDLLKWKKKRKYGHRWMIETTFSSLKRMFGEHVAATRFQNMVKEMMIKGLLYNLFRRIV
jgi:IS5 family transposase